MNNWISSNQKHTHARVIIIKERNLNRKRKRENRRYLQFFFSSKIGRSASRLNIKINCNDFSENLAYIRTCTSLADGTDNNLLIEGSWTFLESSACVARDAITIPPSRHDCINGYLLSSSKVGSQKTADSERRGDQWLDDAKQRDKLFLSLISLFYSTQKPVSKYAFLTFYCYPTFNLLSFFFSFKKYSNLPFILTSLQFNQYFLANSLQKKEISPN